MKKHNLGFSQIKKIDLKTINGIGGVFERVSETKLNYTKKKFNERFDNSPSCSEAYINSQYVVTVFISTIEFLGWKGDIKHLVIKPIDDGTIINHWKVLQRIKNEVCGEEFNAIEIYPKEQNLVDGANVYHLWVFPEDFNFGFGIHLPGWF